MKSVLNTFYVSRRPVLKQYGLLSAFLLPFASNTVLAEQCIPTLIPTPALMENMGDGINIEADSAEIGKEGGTRLRGDVRVSMKGQQIAADAIDVAKGNQSLIADGTVRFRSSQAELDASHAVIAVDSRKAKFENAEFRLYDSEGVFSARGSAQLLETSESGDANLESVLFTTCPPDQDGWQLSASKIRLDEATGSGYARNVKLHFYDVPLLYLPVLSFPYTSARKSGLLAPKFGSSGSSGLDISLPWYWNIAPNLDATLTPRILTKRGLMLDSEWRYLFNDRSIDGVDVGFLGGELDASFLPSDREANRDRYRVNWQHQQSAGSPDQFWQVQVDATALSDTNYYDDLGSDLATVNQPTIHDSASAYLQRRYTAAHGLDYQWSINTSVNRFQVLQPSVTQDTTRQIPSVIADWENRVSDSNLYLGGTARWDRFLRTAQDGDRVHLEQWLAWRLVNPAWYARAKLNYKHTRYLPNEGLSNEHLRRSMATFTAHLGAHFERTAKRGTHILEPSFHILYNPFRDQDHLPIYDTAIPEFNWPWLNADNRYTGIDRIGDSRRGALSVRWQWQVDNKPLAEVRLGQLYEQSTRRFVLPGESASNQRSGILGEAQLLFGHGWRFRGDGEWDGGDNELERARANIIYQAPKLGQLALRWRQRQDIYEQVGFEYRRSIGNSWQITSGMDYSLRDDAALETYALFRYQSCCWAVEMGGRRFVRPTDTPGTRELDTAVYFRFELSGLGEFGKSLNNPFAEENNSWRY